MPRPRFQFLIHRLDTLGNCLNYIDGDAVACLLIGLGIGLDGEDAVDLPFLKALEPQAFAGHETANVPAVFHDSLDTTGFQRMGNITPNAPAAGIAACKSQIHRVTGERFLISFLGGFLDEQNAGAFASVVG